MNRGWRDLISEEQEAKAIEMIRAAQKDPDDDRTLYEIGLVVGVGVQTMIRLMDRNHLWADSMAAGESVTEGGDR